MAGVRDNTVSNVISGGIASFKSVGEMPLKSLKVNFNPIQEGDGDPSPSNIRPIEGWTGLNVFHTGKNLIDGATNEYIINNWSYVSPGYQYKITGLPPDKNFTLQLNVLEDKGENISNCRMYLNGVLTAGKFVNTATPLGVHTITNKPNSSGEFVIAHNGRGLSGEYYNAKFNNVQLELGSNATTYEPYNGTTVPVSWSDLGTVYGGYVDLISGEVWKTFWHYTFTGEQTFYTSGSNWVVAYMLPVDSYYPTAATPFQGICSHYPYAPYTKGKIGVMYNERTCTFDATIYDAAGWKQYCADQYSAGTPIQVAYRLKNPQLIGTIDPITIKSLIGQNNIWSNADTVEAQYCALESLDIYKQRFKSNEPHLETTSGNVVSFTTDMIAPLKECKINFLPIQASGTPSPDNVLPISGWNELSIYKRNKNLLRLDLQEGLAYPTTSANTTPRTFDMETYIVGMSPQNYYRRNYTNWVLNVSVSNNEVNFSSGGASGYGIAFPIFLIPGKSYTLSAISTNNGGMGFIFYDKDGNYISASTWSTAYPRTATIPENTWVTLIIFYATTTNTDFSFTDICLSEGSDSINYEQSVGSYNSITLPSTYYGGYVDLTSGEIWATYEYTNLGEKNWTADDQTTQPGCFRSGNSNFGGVNGIKYMGANYCSQFTAVQKSSWTQVGYGEISVTNATFNPIVRIRDERFVDKTGDEVKTLLSGVYYAYERAVPRLVGTLTSQQLKTLKNQNNIWSNTNGITEVKYWTHGSIADKRKVVWNQWLKPLTADNWQAYSTNYINATFSEDQIATSTWIAKSSGYSASIRDKVGVLQSEGQIWYISYMMKSSVSGLSWGVEFCGGRQDRSIVIANDTNTWYQVSSRNSYYRGTRNYSYILNLSNTASDDFIGMTAQCKSPILINLTQMFGASNQPTKAEFEALCAKNGIDLTQYHPYDEGTEVYWYF